MSQTHSESQPGSDGLSIPFFNVGRNIHTLTLTNTLGTRSRTVGGSIRTPDWLLSVRHSPVNTPLPQYQSAEAYSPQVPPTAVTRNDKGSQLDVSKIKTADVPDSPPVPGASSNTNTKKVVVDVAPPVIINEDQQAVFAADTDGDTILDNSASDIADAQYADVVPASDTSSKGNTQVRAIPAQ